MTGFPADLAAWDPARLADQIDQASRAAHTPARPGWLPVLCECGHPVAAHRGGRSLNPDLHRERPCLIDGCACSDFRESRNAA